jgi:site-specific DNA-methyltransferase (adenine-specific)
MDAGLSCHWTVLEGDAWQLAAAKPSDWPLARAVVTSPPYWQQRIYMAPNQELGHEITPDAFAARLARLFVALAPWLESDAVIWLNLGDTYRDSALQMVPARAVLALESLGWHLRSEVIFERENFTPRPSPKRPQRSHEHVFLLSRTSDYYYDDTYMREPAKYAGYHYVREGVRNDDGRLRMDGATTVAETRILRSVWRGPTGWNDTVDHPALMPRLMAERCVLSVTKPGDIVLDPFSGSGTTGVIALEHGRSYVGFEQKPEYVMGSRARLSRALPLLSSELPADELPALDDSPKLF